jgi:hypothetical protein
VCVCVFGGGGGSRMDFFLRITKHADRVAIIFFSL